MRVIFYLLTYTTNEFNMKQYIQLGKKILKNGRWKTAARENMPRTLSISSARMEHDLEKGFPLLTTKKMYMEGIFYELIWILSGDTNIKYLVDNDTNIWNKDAYKWYLEYTKTMVEPDYEYLIDDHIQNKSRVFTMNEFISQIKRDELGTRNDYKLGDLGKVYGHQWRNQNGVDQIRNLIKGIETNKFSRYHIIDAWNMVDVPQMALPPCHLLYQFIVRPEKSGDRLDLNMYQRSGDTALGIPYNWASMALLTHLIAKLMNMVPGKIYWSGGDTHLYESHIEIFLKQIKRRPKKLPTFKINKRINNFNDVLKLKFEDIEIKNYKSHPRIKYELSVGL